MKELLRITAISCLSLFLSSGCQDIADELVDKKPEDTRAINIAMIAKGEDNPVFQSALAGAEAAAEELTDKYSKIDVKIHWRTPVSEGAEKQAEKIRLAVTERMDAIIISCSDDSILNAAIDEAVDKGVHVMTFDSDAPNSKRFAFYGPDDKKIGEKVMNELAGLIGEKGEVAILGGNSKAPNLKKRVEGVRNAATKFSGINLVGTFYHAENAEAASAEFLKVNELYPNLKGWAMVGGWPFFSDHLLSRIDSSKIKIVAVDALPVQLPYIEKGLVSAFFGQPTFRWGEFCVEKIVDKLYNEEEVEETTEMKLIKVSLDNLGGWSRQLRAWGYKGLPDEYLVM